MTTRLPPGSFRPLATSAASILAFSFVSNVRAAERFWADAVGQTTWSSAASWSNGLPANSAVTDTATFNSVANAQPVVTANRSINGIDFRMAAGGLNFTSSAGVTMRLGSTGIDATGQLSGTNTISVETLELNANPTWTIFSNTDSATTSTFTVSSNVNINGQNWVITPNRNTAAGNVGIVNFSGVLSGSLGATGLQLYGANFRNTVSLSGLNTYTGRTSIRAEVIANSLANAGTASSFGQSGDIVLGNSGSSATLTFNNLTADGTTDRLVLFQGTGSANYVIGNNSATGRVSFTNPGNIGSAAAPTANALNILLRGSNTELNTFGQIIHDRTNSGITNVRKEQAGTWVLEGDNSYTGTTTLAAGSLFINGDQSLATGSVSVTAAGSTLGGTGTVGGAVTVADVSFLAPGVMGIGQFSLANGLNLDGGLNLQIGGSGGVKGVDFDSLRVTAGSVSFGASSKLSVASFGGYDLTQAGSYGLYDFAFAPTGNFNSVSVGSTALTYDGLSGTWTDGSSIVFDHLTGVLDVSVIPEPSSVAALAGLFALAGVVVRRRRA